MPSEEPIQGYEQRPTFSTWIGVVLLFAFFALLALVILNAMPRLGDYDQKRAQTRFEKLHTMQQETAKALNSYAWVDKSKGIARIPIADAMKLTMAELAQKKPAPANPIATPASAATPAPGATPQGTAASSPGPGATPQGTAASLPAPGATPHGAAASLPAPGATPHGAAASSPAPGATPHGAAASSPASATPTRSATPKSP